MELKQNPSNQPATKPKGPDTLFFEAMKGRQVKCVYLLPGENEYTVGKLIDYDKYGVVLDTGVTRVTEGPTYVFKAALACIFPLIDK